MALALLVTLVAPPSAQAEKRIALVIGNGAYVKVPRLPNPTSDSAAMSGLLRKAGFDVVEKTDMSADAMRRVLRDLSELVRYADIAVVFYAGYGMEMNGINYLIPVDATLARDVDVEDEAISLDRVIRSIEPARRLQLVILDSCRDNPFLRSMRRTVISRSVRSGHGDIDEKSLPPNTLIAYAQKAGATAEDGTGTNSPYTTALLKHLPTPGLDVELALRRVRDEVLQATRNRQEPFKYGSLGGAELPLVTAVAGPLPPASPQPVSTAEREWQQYGKDTKDIRLLEAFKEKHRGDPVYARLAEARIEELKKQTASAARPSEPAKPGLLPGVLKETVGIVLPGVQPARCDGVETIVGNDRRCLKPGVGKAEWFKDCETCPEMVVVPAGTFTMGSPENERPLKDMEEQPAHEVGVLQARVLRKVIANYETQVRVSIAKPFAVGRFAVTFDQWDACVADGGCNGYKPDDKGWGRGEYPVININWDDARSYIAWLSRKTGKIYRLLSEAEREYVTRAGTTTPFWWGTTITSTQANFNGKYVYPVGSKGEFRQRTVPVGSFQANPWGLYNVHGNVEEWTEDCWYDDNKGNPGDGRARTSRDCRRATRGGSWNSEPEFVRSASRDSQSADYRGSIGFRVARALAP
jgi:formylglycine-generating enzyme required for sulfatase activity